MELTGAPTRRSALRSQTCSAAAGRAGRLHGARHGGRRTPARRVAAGVHVVIGTTGFDLGELRHGLTGANVFIAPNFAIGAVLMMQFAAAGGAAHGASRDHRAAPRPQARQAERDRGADGRADGGGRAAATGEVPIHSVRLPGLVAHQEVILGDVGQTLTIRHDSIDRESFMPGVLLAIRRVGTLTESPVVGLEKLLEQG